MKVVINRYQFIATATATLCIMTSGMHYGWASSSIPKLLDGSHLHVTNEESSWIVAIPLIAAAIGAIFSGTILNFLGRKNTIVLSGIPYTVSWLMIAFSYNVELIYCARFLTGLSDGIAFTAVPMYLGEIADPSIRGLLGSSCSISLNLGLLFINGLGLYFSISTTALISTLLPILLMVTFYFMPESPYYLIMKGRFDNAKKSLKILKGIKDVDKEFNRMVTCVQEDASNTHFFNLFTMPNNRKAIFIMIGVRILQQVSGITAITSYIHIIFQETGQHISAELTTLTYYVVQLIMVCLSSFIMDKAGRRPLMLISTTGTAVSLMAEGIYVYLQKNTTVDVTHFNFVPIVAIITFIISYNIGMGTVPLLMLGELFATDVKAFAICLSDVTFCITAAVNSKFFQITKDNFGMYVPFFSFSICCFLGILFIIFYLPETKGKTLEEIQDEFKGIKRVDPREDKDELP